MNTRGLIALIVINIGLDIGVLGARSFTLLILMALVTTFLTSPLVYWAYIKHLPAHEQQKRTLSIGAAEAQHVSGRLSPDRTLSSFLTTQLTNVILNERDHPELEHVPRNLLGQIAKEREEQGLGPNDSFDQTEAEERMNRHRTVIVTDSDHDEELAEARAVARETSLNTQQRLVPQATVLSDNLDQ